MDIDAYFGYLNNKLDNTETGTLEEYAKRNRIPIINKAGLNFLKLIIMLTRSVKILEVGAAIGYSAISMALVNEEINITTFEKNGKMYDKAVENIEKFRLRERINIINKDALEVNINCIDKGYDLMFIDAAKSQYRRLFEVFSPCVRKKGVIVSDNIKFHDLVSEEEILNKNTRQLVKKIKLYNEWLKNNELYDTIFFNIGDGISVSIKK